MTRSGFIFSTIAYFRSRILVTTVCVLTFIVAMGACVITSHNIYNAAINDYIMERKSEFDTSSRDIQKVFDITHDTLKAITLLPDIRVLKSNIISKSTRATIQEFYNILFNHVAVSELYLVPLNMDPQGAKGGPVPVEPIATWDEYIASSEASHALPAKTDQAPIPAAPKFPEVEDFEYAAMTKQLARIKSHYFESIDQLPFMPETSPVLITCDNSEMSAAHFNHSDNEPRLGIVYSYPILSMSGAPIGMMSAVLRKEVLQSILKHQDLSLEWGSGILCGNGHCPEENSNPSFEQSITFKQTGAEIWTLTMRKSQAEFKASEQGQRAGHLTIIASIAIFAVTIIFGGIFGGLFAIKTRAESLAKNMIGEVNKKQEELVMASRLSSLGEIAASIAHEVNNPATIMAGYGAQIRQLAKKGPIPSDVAETIGVKIENTATRIAKIVRSIKTIARNASSDPMEACDIGSLVDDVHTLLKGKLRDADIEFKIENQMPPHSKFEARATEIGQVLVNLIGNAHDAIQEFKTGKDQATIDSASWIKLTIESSDHELIFRVANGGQKIPDHIADKLFTPFFTTKPRGQGTGLGLSISLKIMASHNGNLEINKASAHTEFVVRTPLTQNLKKSA